MWWCKTAVRAHARFAPLEPGVGLCRVLVHDKLYVDTEDHHITPHLILDGFWEMWVGRAMAQFVRRGDTAIDVGANYGYFSLLMANLVGKNGHVHAFEPNPPIYELLRRSIHINGLSSYVTAHSVALGAQEATSELIVPPNAPGGAAVRTHVIGDFPAGTPIQVRRLDAEIDWAKADFIKIDAEGAEAAIWAGMDGLLRGRRLKTAIIEFAAVRYPDPKQFLSDLTGHGFRLYELTHRQGVRRRTAAQILAKDPGREIMLLLRR